jgi:glycylpeptide N-tetradecanoyltransferase
MARTIKLYKLPSTPTTPGLRPMTAADAPAVAALLNGYLARFKLSQHFTAEEAAHWLTPRELVVDAYVVDAPPASSSAAAAAAANGGASAGTSSSGSGAPNAITDVVSFYTLPSSVLGHPEHTEIRAAYMFYTAATTVPLPQLLGDAMALAAAKGYDVFNALDLLDNGPVLKELKFGVGDGALQYYLYNWRMAAAPIEPGETGLILL